MTEITIKALKDIESMRRVEALQVEIWGMPDLDVVPSHQLLAAAGAGGAVLGAFDPDGTMVGFCYGFAGWRERRPLFYSHMAGVKGARQLQDVGFRLKCAQREAALAMGLEHAVWTYDPLQSVNARFNLHKLGATARRYYVNYYGEMPDALNRGLDSDRLEVDWALRSPRVHEAISGSARERNWDRAPHALEGRPHPVGREPSAEPPGSRAGQEPAGVAPGEPNLTLREPVILLEVPTDFAALRQQSLHLAQAWRMASRETLVHYFGRGYCAVDFLLRPPHLEHSDAGSLRGHYVLVQDGDEY